MPAKEGKGERQRKAKCAESTRHDDARRSAMNWPSTFEPGVAGAALPLRERCVFNFSSDPPAVHPPSVVTCRRGTRALSSFFFVRFPASAQTSGAGEGTLAEGQNTVTICRRFHLSFFGLSIFDFPPPFGILFFRLPPEQEKTSRGVSIFASHMTPTWCVVCSRAWKPSVSVRDKG